MNRSFSNALVACALTVLVVLPLASVGAEDAENQSESVQVALRATGMNWRPKVEFGSAVLTVSGPDDAVLRKEFAAGEALEFNLADAASSGLPDGQYSWELRFSPPMSQEQKDRLRAARESGDEAAINELKSKGKMPTAMAPSSGYFRISGGNIVVAERTEKPLRRVSPQTEGDAQPGAVNDQDAPVATKDQVITDDLIVDGSACIGLDCVNGENFGFDTLRLKENNTRIKFDDTSNSGSFPNTDWQLTANDSANGGANKFSIDDTSNGRTPFTIEHPAPNNSLFVDGGGRIGFGTSAPVVELHVVDGDTPTLRLEQDGSSGFTPQTWDLAGNETNFFIRDVTNGSKLPFKIRPNAPTNSMYVNTNGDVGLGTSSPAAKLHVFNGDLLVERTTSSDHAAIYLTQSGSANPSSFLFQANASSGALVIKDANASATALKFRSGAANNSIVVAPEVGGQPRVGIGTANPAGTLDVQGTIFLSGTQIHPDFVFQPGYVLESIEDHAAYMWTNRHLPAVGRGEYDENGMARFELGKQQVGMLEELEKAHIYIAQLSETVEKLEDDTSLKDASIDSLRRENEKLEKRLVEIEALLQVLVERDSH